MTDAVAMIRVERLRKLLARLIDLYSPTGKEQEVVDFLHDYLTRRKMPVRLQRVDERRSNLIVMPPGAQVQLGFIGHVDTIAAHDLEAYGYREEGDDRIYGLGAADMKGGCAAMIEAFDAFLTASSEPPPVALCLVVGEEEWGDGTARLLEELSFPWAIDGEPTDLVPCFRHDGYLEVELRARGQQKHASLAGGSTAIAVELELVQAMARHLDRNRPELIYNIRDLHSSGGGFVVPERCEARLDLHLPSSVPLGDVITELEALVDSQRASASEIDVDIEFVTADEGFDIPTPNPLAEVLEAAFERRSLPYQPGVFRSHSDANLLWAHGVRPVILGPGSLEHAHISDESVSFTQVQEAARLYLQILKGVTATPPGF